MTPENLETLRSALSGVREEKTGCVVTEDNGELNAFYFREDEEEPYGSPIMVIHYRKGYGEQIEPLTPEGIQLLLAWAKEEQDYYSDMLDRLEDKSERYARGPRQGFSGKGPEFMKE